MTAKHLADLTSAAQFHEVESSSTHPVLAQKHRQWAAAIRAAIRRLKRK